MSSDNPQRASQQHDLGPWLTEQAATLDHDLHTWARAESRWSLARLATFLLAALAWLPFQNSPPIALLAVAAGLALFVWTIRRHRHAASRHTFLKLRKIIIDEARQRAGGTVATVRSTARPLDVPVARNRLAQLLPTDPAWPLTEQERDDLDLYASPAGIFGLLNRTSTNLGAMRLRDGLENPLLSADRILARQQAVRHLAEHHPERTRLLAALAGLRGLDAQMPVFEGAVESARPVLPTPLLWMLRLWSGLVSAFALYASWQALSEDYAPMIWLGLVLTANVLLWMPLWLKVRRALLQYQRSFDLAREYWNASRQAAADLPPDTPLADLRRIFHAVSEPAALPKALGWIGWTAGGGFLQVLLDLVAFYDVHILDGIQRHVVPHREPLLSGLAALAELEALLSLGCFAAEQPHTCWPEPLAGRLHLSIRRGLHPLIDPAADVPNDLTLSAQPNLYIITGSNMSGKSTYLRMIGVNVLLAQIGTAACAESLTFSPLRLISDLRIRDNLGKGESYFLAEVRHLRRMIVPPPGDVPVLGLVDEPFRGTNHREQRAATLAIIEHLLTSPGLFLIATHDSTVTRLADGTHAQNHHFQEQLGPRELVFDYQLRPGPARTRNALRVLEREHYPADLVRRALAHADTYHPDDETEQDTEPKTLPC